MVANVQQSRQPSQQGWQADDTAGVDHLHHGGGAAGHRSGTNHLALQHDEQFVGGFALTAYLHPFRNQHDPTDARQPLQHNGAEVAQ